MREKEFPVVDALMVAEFKASGVRIFDGHDVKAADLNELFEGKSRAQLSNIAVVVVTNDGVHHRIHSAAMFDSLPNIESGVNRVLVMLDTLWRYWWDQRRLPPHQMVDHVEKEA